MTSCPSTLELEAYLLGPERSPAAAHVRSCPRCLARLSAMRGTGDEFHREVYPATIDAILDQARPRRERPWLAKVAPLAAAAAILVVGAVVLRRPAPDYVGTKGPPLQLTVFVDRDGGARAASDGEAVPSRAAIRFQVGVARPCQLWVVSVDSRGQVSRIFPLQGDTGADVRSTSTLPGGAVLDGVPGPERIFAVCSPTGVPLTAVEQAARVAASGGPGAVRNGRELTGLPAEAWQATVLLEKSP